MVHNAVADMQQRHLYARNTKSHEGQACCAPTPRLIMPLATLGYASPSLV
jgi:hypothetical protein